jgi:hypothetical protein
MSALAADATFLEKAGIPVAAIGGDALVRTVGRSMARAHGYPDYPFVSIAVFVRGRLTEADFERYTENAFVQLEHVLAPDGVPARTVSIPVVQSANRQEFPTAQAAVEYFFDRGWTDGLPITPPTPALVRQFLDAADLEPEAIVAEYRYRARIVSAEKVATNAIMAGCKPEYMPYIVAACKAVTQKSFALNHIASLASPAPLVIVNGPTSQQLGFNAGMYVFGPGNRPNATVGRALSLILSNCFEARTGGLQRGTMGHAARWGFCIAENEHTLWPTLHMDQGFQRIDDVVTVYPSLNPPISFWSASSLSAEHAAESMARVLARQVLVPVGTYYLFVLSPAYQDIFLKDGWSKDDVRHYMVEHCAETIADLKRNGRWQFYGTPDGRPPTVEPGDEGRLVYLLKRDEYRAELWQADELDHEPGILIVVAGGDAGPVGTLIPSYGLSPRPVSVRVESARADQLHTIDQPRPAPV